MNLIVLNAAAVAGEASAKATGYTDKLLNLTLKYGPRVVAAILILIIGAIVAKLFAKAVYRASSKSGNGESLSRFLSGITNAAIMTFVVIAMISKLGVETTSFLAVFGAAGLAVGLALQGTLSNLASGVLLIIFRPFNIGDGISVGAVSGTVLDMQIFSTIVQTPDNKKVIVPNSKIASDIITNYTVLGSRRLEIPVLVAPELDLNAVRTEIAAMLDQDARVLKNPDYDMVVTEWGDKIKLMVRPFALPKDCDSLSSDLIEKINLKLKTMA